MRKDERRWWRISPANILSLIEEAFRKPRRAGPGLTATADELDLGRVIPLAPGIKTAP